MKLSPLTDEHVVAFLCDGRICDTCGESFDVCNCDPIVRPATNCKETVARKISGFFRWYDLWIGLYIDRANRTVYVCPIPMFGVKIQL